MYIYVCVATARQCGGSLNHIWYDREIVVYCIYISLCVDDVDFKLYAAKYIERVLYIKHPSCCCIYIYIYTMCRTGSPPAAVIQRLAEKEEEQKLGFHGSLLLAGYMINIQCVGCCWSCCSVSVLCVDIIYTIPGAVLIRIQLTWYIQTSYINVHSWLRNVFCFNILLSIIYIYRTPCSGRSCKYASTT